MEALVAALTWFVGKFFNVVSSAVSAIVGAFSWPAHALGIPPEILAAAVLCALLLALWRAMGGYIT
jgi:hypothetical protein